MQGIYNHIKGDKVIWIVVFFLLLFSILAVYSSINTLAYKHQSGNQFYYLFKHGVILSVGLSIMFFIHRIKYNYFAGISVVAIILAIPLLALTLKMGANLNDASRWLAVPGLGLTFQTSDFAKLALIVYLARALAKYQDKDYSLKETALKIFLPVIVVCMLILPANFSTCALLFTTSLILMFIGSIKTKFLLSFLGIGFLGIGLILLIGFTAPQIFPRFATWIKRIENFKKVDSDANYQADQAKIAIATGGITGKGPGHSTQRNFLPHPYSDFIFAFIVEEYGLSGGIFIILLYMVLLFRGVRIATRCKGTFGSLLAFGLSFSLVFQALINMAVASNLFPVTGQPLPLVSMGGTSIWFTSIAIGIILSVSKETELERETTD